MVQFVHSLLLSLLTLLQLLKALQAARQNHCKHKALACVSSWGLATPCQLERVIIQANSLGTSIKEEGILRGQECCSPLPAGEQCGEQDGARGLQTAFQKAAHRTTMWSGASGCCLNCEMTA